MVLIPIWGEALLDLMKGGFSAGAKRYFNHVAVGGIHGGFYLGMYSLSLDD